MAAFRDDMPLVAINENWDENTTRSQIVRPDWELFANTHENHDIFSTTIDVYLSVEMLSVKQMDY